MKSKCSISLVVFALLLFFWGLGIVGANEKPDFEIKIKSNGAITYQSLGIQGGVIPWGTEKFAVTIDGGETEYIIYCLNNDLDTNYDLLNKNLTDFNHLYREESIRKILYYGFGGPGYSTADKDKLMNDPNYKIWMPIDGDWIADQWSDDMVYTLTHLAISYAYYHDVLSYSEEEASDRAFYMVAESYLDSPEGTRAKSVAKMWYDMLVAKPSFGISLSSENNVSITYLNSSAEKPLSINFNEKITVSGNNVANGGRIEFVVPANVKCTVTGNADGATAPGSYNEGTKLTVGSGQSFYFSLIAAVDHVENLHIDFYENYSAFHVDGGETDESDYQDLAGIYPSGNRPLAIELKFAGPYDYTNPETGAFLSYFAIILGVSFASALIVVAMKNKKFNKI